MKFRVKKSYYKWIVKAILGSLLIYYVLHSNLVDISSVKAVLFAPLNLLFSGILLLIITACMSGRMHAISHPLFPKLSFSNFLEISMVGQFFSTFLPGSVGADLIRGWYLSNSGDRKITSATQSILWDRAIGLTVTCTAGALASYTLTSDSTENAWIGNLQICSTVISISLICIGLFFRFFAPKGKIAWIKNAKLASFWSLLVDFRPPVKTLFLSVFLSSLSLLLTIVFAMYCGSAIGITLDARLYAVILPIGILVSAIPLLPLGIGLGQVAYANLFVWLGHASANQGATLCTLMQCYSLLFSFLGLISYLRMGLKK